MNTVLLHPVLTTPSSPLLAPLRHPQGTAVVRDGGPSGKELARLGCGAYFGERALLGAEVGAHKSACCSVFGWIKAFPGIALAAQTLCDWS